MFRIGGQGCEVERGVAQIKRGAGPLENLTGFSGSFAREYYELKIYFPTLYGTHNIIHVILLYTYTVLIQCVKVYPPMMFWLWRAKTPQFQGTKMGNQQLVVV